MLFVPLWDYNSVLQIVFKSVQQKHLDKMIFHQQFVNFAGEISKSCEPTLYPIKAYEISTRPWLLLTNNLPCYEVTVLIFCIILITNHTVRPVKSNLYGWIDGCMDEYKELKCTENGQLLDVISSTDNLIC